MKKAFMLAMSICLAWCMLTISAYAYCDLYFDGIEQSEEKMSVNWGYDTSMCLSERDVRIVLYQIIDGSSEYIEGQDCTVYADGTGKMCTEYDSKDFVVGSEYRVMIMFTGEYCGNCGNCGNNPSRTKDFTAQYGCSVYTVSNTFGESITLGLENITLEFTASESGFYQLFAESNRAWSLEIMNNAEVSLSNEVIYLEKNQSVYFTVKIADWANLQSCTAKFKVCPADFATADVLTANPGDGDTVFSLESKEGLVKLDVPKTGVYEINTTCGNNGNVKLYSESGEELFYGKFNTTSSALLTKGTYYYWASPWSTPSESYTTVIEYSMPEELSFGTSVSTDTYDCQYLYFKLDEAAALYQERESGYLYISIYSDDKSYDGLYENNLTILPAGEYYFEYYGSGSSKIVKKDIPVTVIGNEVEYIDFYDTKYAVLQAPETAEYEIYSSYSYTIGDEHIMSDIYYHSYINLNKDEEIYVKFREPLTAKKFTLEYTALTVGDKYSFNINDGKRTGLSFTADEEGTYIFNFDEGYFGKIKVYTENEVICEDSDTYMDKDLAVKLAEDETVYILIEESDGDFTVGVTEKEKPLQISGNTVVDCSNPDWSERVREIVYTPSVAGYYNFTVSEPIGESSYSYIRIEMEGAFAGEVSTHIDGAFEKMIYAAPDEPLYIAFIITDQQNASVELTFERVTSKRIEDISDFEITDNSFYSFVLPEDGVYQIVGNAYYDVTSWRDEGVYPYFFTPIIKNAEETSFSYDSDEGDVPVYFCGTKGTEVLFKEEQTDSYYPFEYPIKASISKVDTEAVRLGALASTNNGCKMFSINITKAGEYKFEDLSDDLYDPNAGTWGTYYGRGFAAFCVDGKWVYIADMVEEGEEKAAIFSLNPGTYYVAAAVYDFDPDDEHIPEARFKITAVGTDTPDDEVVEISGTMTATGVDYTISGDIPESAVLYAALYEGNRLKEVKAVKNPACDDSVTFDNSVSGYECRLFLWNANFNPLCTETICD